MNDLSGLDVFGNNHAYVRFVGYGLTVTPITPFEASANIAGDGTIDIQPQSGGLARIIARDGGFRSALSPTIASVYDCVLVETGDARPQWQLETSLYRFNWPEGMSIYTVQDLQARWPFEMKAMRSLVAFIQVPRTIPPVEQMAASDQTVVKIGEDTRCRWVMLAYHRDGERWLQRHSIVTVRNREVVVTVQAPEKDAEVITSIANQVTASLQ